MSKRQEVTGKPLPPKLERLKENKEKCNLPEQKPLWNQRMEAEGKGWDISEL